MKGSQFADVPNPVIKLGDTSAVMGYVDLTGTLSTQLSDLKDYIHTDRNYMFYSDDTVRSIKTIKDLPPKLIG
ncbi:hypothetical protein [Celerinatantimonas diazotrophica]|uniref:hypothetical protein n=1 Tax=Celerinatantimonas diazotrophica TaxID=412034 RepID=UPI001404F578|nr:hypothetical protein [Celerinatantimonas diazotrophica]